MAALALTLAVMIGWAGAVALGYWHGGWRQVVVLAGILLSSAVLSEWAGPNGRDLTAQFGWPLARATTSVALLYLSVGAVTLGYLGGLLLPRPAPLAPRERQCGALLGLLNGGLLLALALRIARSYAFAPGEGRALRDSGLARFLIEQVGYLVMAAFIAGLGAVLAGFVRARQRDTAGAVAPASAVVSPIPNAAPVAAASAATPVPEHSSGEDAAADPYAAPLAIDWPARLSPAAPPVSPAVPPPSARPARAATLPTTLDLPPRVAPPLWYPVASLMGAERRPTAATLPAVPAPPPMPVSPPSPTRPAPPGVPVVPPAAAGGAIAVTPDNTLATPPAAPAEAREPARLGTAAVVTATAADDAAPERPPPPRPPSPAVGAGQPPRAASYARVAQPRQPERPPSPPPEPPAEERGPLRPPLPTGPDVYGCPTCGYPVRRHARYCPNCGARLR